MTSRSVAYIIVGQGLAGSAVALQLLRQGKRILVIDQPSRNTSSRIAAGLFNPITGRKMVKTWMADSLFPYLFNFYREAESLTARKFFHPMPLYRPFHSIEEQNEWMGKSATPAYAPYIEKITTGSTYPNVNDPYGGLLLQQCGYVDTTTYTAAVGELIAREGILLQEDLDENALTIGQGVVRYRDVEAGGIIFCNGVHTTPWFNWLPVKPLKGEAIRIRASFDEHVILNRGVYMVPTGEPGAWRVGATYDFQNSGPGVTESARKELHDKINELVHFPVDVTGQEWGVRPTTPDRRPLLGKHPENDSVFVFNGMGTKGVSLAPYFSEVLIQALQNMKPLNKEVDIERYKLLYWTSPK
ncbi:NAD(P)/FAD-dependent oxidoreductase [Chryseolinea lacunae]|uniref:FAD-binding oxidoreductase n=1 Tax=Chryseolinea lacunae TaxID=2801331 RepID=A0ABS1KUN3_9BACT|nr:FAD-dependent oxidoreductase [Chryseolinea lacunae]MBL0742417.1 FAD-binding oxidoreductase [Chryseolinea lacunae]